MKKSILFGISILLTVLSMSFIFEKKELNGLPKILRNNFAFVEDGTVSIESKVTSIQSFYISTTEVSNFNYREFLADLKATGNEKDLKTALLDTVGWNELMTYGEPMVNHYHSHPAYDNFPVSNVSYKAAKLYCKWLSGKLNDSYESNYEYIVRLPSREEWIRASRPNDIEDIYSWGGPFLRDAKGQLLCNFKRVGAEQVHFNSSTGKLEVIADNQYIAMAGKLIHNKFLTSTVKSNVPNDYGIYNMNGNVAEMVEEPGIAVGGSWNSTGYDVRNESYVMYQNPSSTIGFRTVLELKKK